MNVGETDWEVDREDDQDDVTFRVTQRSETIVFLLSCGIPECELDELAIVVDEGNVVLEHSWDVRLCCAGR